LLITSSSKVLLAEPLKVKPTQMSLPKVKMEKEKLQRQSLFTLHMLQMMSLPHSSTSMFPR
jgi:hypothetical protein